MIEGQLQPTTALIPDDAWFTLRQVDQSCTDFGIIEAELEAIHARLALVPTRVELADAAGGHLLLGGARYRVV